MFWPNLKHFSNLSEQENDAVDHAEALEVVGGWENHVDLKASYCNQTFRRRAAVVAAQTACVWRIGIGRGVLVLLANFTIRFCKGLLTMLSSLRWHENAGAKKEDE